MSDAHLTDRARQHDSGARHGGRPGYDDTSSSDGALHSDGAFQLDGRQPFELSEEPIRLSRPGTDQDETAGRPWSRRRKVILALGLAVGLAGAGAIGAFGWRVASQSDPRLDAPAQIAGLSRDDSDRARSTADYLRSGFAADIDLDSSFGVVYRDPGDEKRAVLVFGGTARIWQPERDLGRLFELMNDETGTVQGLRDVPAGKLGGVMKCGTTTGEDTDFSVCGWADHGSAAIAMLPGRPVEEAGELFRQIREAIQTRD